MTLEIVKMEEEDEWPEHLICPIHGRHENLVCIPCYDVQAERVERESAPLRHENTTSALRKKVVAMMNVRRGDETPAPIKCQNCGSMNTWYDPGEGWSCGSCWLTDLTPASFRDDQLNRARGSLTAIGLFLLNDDPQNEQLREILELSNQATVTVDDNGAVTIHVDMPNTEPGA